MSKSSVFLLLMIAGQLAMASGVKVTSFHFLETGTRLSPTAELCGEIIAPAGKPELIRIVSDPQSKGPAIYNVWSGKDGKFCSVLASYTGKADADLD